MNKEGLGRKTGYLTSSSSLQDEIAPNVQHVVQCVEVQALGNHRSVGVSLCTKEHQEVQVLQG